MLDKNFTCIAKTLQGLEGVLSNEIKTTLGLESKLLKRAVSFNADLKTLYRANLELRTALSIIIPILQFEANDIDALYRNVNNYKWEKLITPSNTLAINATSYSEIFTHSQYAALKVKDAIVDRLRDKLGKRPNIDTFDPDFDFNLHINNKSITLSLNSSGLPLNRRNYRHKQGVAPLNEVLASGMLLIAGYDGEQPFYDYMCGSGTIAIEAGLIATKTPPGAFRKKFGFYNWPNFDEKLWDEVYKVAMSKKRKASKGIFASDKSAATISEVNNNVQAAELGNVINIKKQKFEKAESPKEPSIIMMNLPYDKRLELEDASEFYKLVSDVLKQNFKNNEAWILGPKTKSFKSFALKPAKKINLLNASIECTLNNYQLY